MYAVITNERLVDLVDEIRPQLWSGAVSTYLPQLSEGKVDELAVSLETVSGETISAGDSDVVFSIQSVAKVFSLLLAIHDRGAGHVFERVGRDQAPGAFNSLDTFKVATSIPVNPFVNSGALTIVDMLDGEDANVRVSRVLQLIRDLANNAAIDVNMDIAREEFSRSDRNRAICYVLRSCGLVTSDVEDLLWAYCQLCAIEVNVADLARAGVFLARDARIRSVEDLPHPKEVRAVQRLMLTTGMYTDSGRYACDVGIPAKCGVSGAMLGTLPDVGGIGVYGPALNGFSNSLGGTQLMEALSIALDVK